MHKLFRQYALAALNAGSDMNDLIQLLEASHLGLKDHSLSGTLSAQDFGHSLSARIQIYCLESTYTNKLNAAE